MYIVYMMYMYMYTYIVSVHVHVDHRIITGTHFNLWGVATKLAIVLSIAVL